MNKNGSEDKKAIAKTKTKRNKEVIANTGKGFGFE